MTTAPAPVGEHDDTRASFRDGQITVYRYAIRLGDDDRPLGSRLGSGPPEEIEHVVVGRLVEVLVPLPYCTEARRRFDADHRIGKRREPPGGVAGADGHGQGQG